jgi:hypothetical protein
MLTDLVLETFQRTDAAGSRRGARVRWSAPTPDTEVVIRWHHRADPAPWGDWAQVMGLTQGSFEIFPALAGRYEFEIFDQSPTRSAYEHGFFELDVPTLLESELALPKPSGVELVGPTGELLGSARTFTGRDLRVRWNAVRLDALETPGIGEAPDDQLLELLEARVVGPAAQTLRTVLLPVHVTEWTYSYAQNAEDQPLTVDPASALRTVRLELRWKDRLGRLGPPAVLEVAHTLQLTDTPDLVLLSVSEVALIADDTPITLTAGYGIDQVLETLDVSGNVGSRIFVRATDHVDDFEVNLFVAVQLVYFLRIKDSLDVLLSEVRYDALIFQDPGGFIFTTAAAGPVLSLVQDAEPGEVYTIEFGFVRDREDPSDELIDAISGARRIEVQELKR